MFEQSRRDFINSAWMGAAAVAAGGCVSKMGCSYGGKMATYADKPFKNLRVGVIGLGRGGAGIGGFTLVKGSTITAICDINAARRQSTLKWLADKKAPTPKVYGDKGPNNGAEDWKRLCEDPNVDLVYNATPWELHVPIALYAMKCGKHVAIEVPAAFTTEECWELVETSEKYQRHCMQLENCCYGETELLALSLVRSGVLGEITHGEAAYIHELRAYNYGDWGDAHGYGSGYWNFWRLRHNAKHGGNQYPTHGLCPICNCMDINRGDRFDWVVSADSKQACFEEYGKKYYQNDAWRRDLKVKMGDMNTSIIRTVNGRTIMLQHNVASPRPYSRINLVQGTRGIFNDYPLRVFFEKEPPKEFHDHFYFDAKKTEEVRQKYMHPLWKTAGEIAKKVGGHGGMDFLMVLRLSYCLQQGLPLDMNVYDLASTCCLCELTEKSAAKRGRSMDIPDFTCGGWKTTQPLGLVDVDINKISFNV